MATTARTSLVQRVQLQLPRQALQQRAVAVHAALAPTKEPINWDDITSAAAVNLAGFNVMGADAVPSTVSTSVLPIDADTESPTGLIFFRDTNGWCPFCHMVWMALIEKGVSFDSMLVDLRDKPEWYKSKVTNNQTPAVKIDGKFVCESYDILLMLEEKYPEHSLWPQDPEVAAKARAWTDAWVANKCGGAFARVAFASNYATPSFATARDEMLGHAADLCALIDASGGPFLFGAELTLADLILTPNANSVARHAAPGCSLGDLPQLAAWQAAMEARPSFQRTRVDAGSRSLLSRKIFGRAMATADDTAAAALQEVNTDHIPEVEMADRREAAAKLAANRNTCARRIAERSGVMRAADSPLGGGGPAAEGLDSESNPYLAEAEYALRRVCSFLVTDVHEAEPPVESAAVQVAMLAYFRNLGTAPRDMTAGAMTQLRAACDAVISRSYMP